MSIHHIFSQHLGGDEEGRRRVREMRQVKSNSELVISSGGKPVVPIHFVEVVQEATCVKIIFPARLDEVVNGTMKNDEFRNRCFGNASVDSARNEKRPDDQRGNLIVGELICLDEIWSVKSEFRSMINRGRLSRGVVGAVLLQNNQGA